MDPADFYTGIVADLYGPLKSGHEHPEPYAQFIAESGEPALELGCGDGEPMLDLLRRGIEVEGVDSSADMLDRCRQKAARAGLDVVVHHQRMESLDLPRRYRSIFLAGPTFCLLPDDATAARALRAIRAHLADGGSVLVPLFVPDPTPDHRVGRVKEARAADGATIRVSVRSEERDETQRIQRTVLRYERLADGESTVVDRPWTLHWYTPAGFRRVATAAGLAAFVVGNEPVGPDATEFTFELRASGRS